MARTSTAGPADGRANRTIIKLRELEIKELKALVEKLIYNQPSQEVLNVDIINESDNELPQYEVAGAAGMDLRAFLKKGITIKPGETKLVPTGLKMNIPIGYELQIRSRSGLSLKSQVTMLNSPGTVDSGYQGDIGLIVHNGGEKGFKIKNGDRIAQGVFAKHETVVFKPVEVFTVSTERGSDGFGSTNVD